MRLTNLLEENKHSVLSVMGQQEPIVNTFSCSNKYLTSFEGSPVEIKDSFYCGENSFRSFEHAPVKVGGSISCRRNDLTSLKGMPAVGGYIDLRANRLVTLEGAPAKVNGTFDCSWNYRLTSLKGGPTEVDGKFDCNNCEQLTSLEGAPAIINGDFECYNNVNIKSLQNIHKQIKQINGEAAFQGCKIASHVLGLLKIKGLTKVTFSTGHYKQEDLKKLEEIINKHLAGTRNVFTCLPELEAAGLEEYAQL